MTDATIATLVGGGVAVILGVANVAANVFLAMRQSSIAAAVAAGSREAASHADDIRSINKQLTYVAAAVPAVPVSSPLGQPTKPAAGQSARPLPPLPCPPSSGPPAASSPPTGGTARPARPPATPSTSTK